MINTFSDLLNMFKGRERTTISVAVAEDADVLLSVQNAYQLGLINAILVGDQAKIQQAADENGIDMSVYEIVHASEKSEACLEAVRLVHDGKAQLPMKGFVDTSVFLRAVLNKEVGLKAGSLISHVGIMEVPGYDRFILVTDSAMTIAPSLEDKVSIINNAVRVAHSLGNPEPKVAVLCAVETVNPKMECTVDAAKLTEMNEQGIITGCQVKGPLQLDNAVSVEAARHKGINHPVAGNADILVVPDIEAGNILNKSMEYFARAKKAGVIMGARTPIILTSRATSSESKMYSIAASIMALEAAA